MDRKWTLIYIGKTKLYTLTEHRLAGGMWHPIAQTEWSTLDGALKHIAAGTVEAIR